MKSKVLVVFLVLLANTSSTLTNNILGRILPEVFYSKTAHALSKNTKNPEGEGTYLVSGLEYPISEYFSASGRPSRVLVDELRIPQLDLSRSECTVVFTRHGEKDRKTQLLTEDGWQQAHALSLSMQDFERRHGKFDYLLHSNEKRSIETASPFVHHVKGFGIRNGRRVVGPVDMQEFLRECHPYSESRCGARASVAFKRLMDYCRQDKGAKIFITSHGSLGKHLMHKMTGGELSGGPDCARPYVFTLASGSTFEKVYQSQGPRLCTN